MEGGILPSRKELLSRIELICDLDRSFIVVTGDQGIGKSTLLEFFIEHHCPNHTKCFVQASEGRTGTTTIQQILMQLLPDQAVDSNLTIAQNLAECRFEALQNVIVVVDNSQYLEVEAFSELIGMLKTKIDNFNASVIFAQPMDQERFSQLNARYPLIEIHLEPLNKAESQMLLAYYFQRTIEVERAEVIRFIEGCDGYPEKLMAWQSIADSSSNKRQWSVKKAIVLGSIACILAISMAIASWYFITTTKAPATNLAELKAQLADKLSKAAQQPSSTVELMDLNAKSGSNSKPKDETSLQLSDETDLDSLLVQKWDPKVLLPHSSNEKLATAENNTENVVVKVEKNKTKQIEQSAKELLARQQTREKQDQKGQDDLLNKMDNQWFLSQPATSVVLQLSGASTPQILQNFLQQHQLGSEAHVYQSIRNGKPWYVVTTGDFTSLKQANAAKGQLPESLRLGEPWAKSIGTIQLEILNANQKNQ